MERTLVFCLTNSNSIGGRYWLSTGTLCLPAPTLCCGTEARTASLMPQKKSCSTARVASRITGNCSFPTLLLALGHHQQINHLTMIVELWEINLIVHKTTNSISGHYSFFLFYLMTLPHLGLSLLPFDKTKFPSTKDILSPNSPFTFKLSLLCLSYICFFFSAIFTLYHTYFWGYHSLRQVYLGAFIGIASHWTVSTILKIIDAAPTLHTLHTALTTSTSADKKVKKEAKEGLNLKDYFKNKPINFDSVWELLKGRLWPLSTLGAYILISAVLALLFTGSVPYSSAEVVMMAVGYPLVCYAFM